MYKKANSLLFSIIFFSLFCFSHPAVSSKPFFCCQELENPRPQHRVTSKTTITFEETQERLRKNSKEEMLRTKRIFEKEAQKEETQKKERQNTD